jgi:hypothetical protein
MPANLHRYYGAGYSQFITANILVDETRKAELHIREIS